MAKIKATRRPQNGSITIYYIHKQSKTHFFIGHVVDMAFWDQKTLRVKSKKGGPPAAEINAIIGHYQKLIEDISSQLVREGLEPTATLVRDRFNKLEEKKKLDTLEMESGVIANKLDIMGLAWTWWNNGRGVKKIWQRSTKKSIKESLQAFERFIDKRNGSKKLLKPYLNLALIQEYENHLFDEGLTKNSVGKRIKHLRQFISTLDDLNFNTSKIRIYQIVKTPIALTEIELTRLENLDLSFNSLLDRCRDMFLIGVYTSLRISDLKRLDSQHFHENRIKIEQQKNKRNYDSEITPQIKRILDKYNHKLPRVSSDDINLNIKEVGRLAGIDQPVEITKELKDHTIRLTKKKYEIMSTHMSIKTCITLLINWGVPLQDVAEHSGKNIRTIQSHYLAADKKRASDKQRELWEVRDHEQTQHLKVV